MFRLPAHCYGVSSDVVAALLRHLSRRASRAIELIPRSVPKVGVRHAVVSAALVVVVMRLRSHFQRQEVRTYWSSVIVAKFGRRLNEGFRYLYQNGFEWQVKRSPEGHSHGESASLRTTADLSLDAFAHKTGRTIYTVSSSSRSTGGRGYHGWFSHKDVAHQPRADPVIIDDIIKLIDVDYYTDMSWWVSHGVPLYLYTFVPKAVAGPTSDGVYTIDDDEVDYRVNGGAAYRHRLWDYDSDWIQVRRWWTTTVCSVEHKAVSDDREVIMITPEYEVWTPLAWLVPGKTLTRRKFLKNGLNYSAYIKDGEAWVSVGKPGLYDCVSYPQSTLEACKIRYNEAKNPHISDLERLACHSGDPKAPVHAAMLYEMMPKICDLPKISRTEGGVFRPTQYQSVKGLVTEDGKPSGVCFAKPLATQPDVVPVDSYNNDLASVEGRVQKTQNTKDPGRRYLVWAREFVEKLVPIPGVGYPLTHAEVDEIQSRPTQRVRTEQQRPWTELRAVLRVSAFQKKECYGAYNDPRTISQCNTSHTLQLSAYTYPFKQGLLKRLNWYGPGKTPDQVAQRLVELCGHTEGVCETDFSRFDGTISPWLRMYIEQAAYLRWVRSPDREDLRGLLQAEVKARCVTTNRIKYSTQGQRLSGSPLTTDGNTIINAFVSYAAARLEGSDPDEAWSRLGIYAGDDGVTAIGGMCAEQAAEDLGLKLKCNFRARDEAVGFLGRIFPGIWRGNSGSIQDPHRTIRKLHISFGNGTDMASLAYNKVSGLLLLDPNAPIVSNWCRLVLRQYGFKGPADMASIKSDDPNVPYMVRFCKEVEANGWPQLEWHDAVRVTADSLGVAASDVEFWCNAIDVCRHTDEAAETIPTKVEEKLVVATDSPFREVSVSASTTTSSDSGVQGSDAHVTRAERRAAPKQLYSRSKK
ncbi:polymerase [Erysiphe necator associated nodavirus 1]|nr:polymerase [Erysiphe necator associated nodavirus 1]